MPHMTGIEFLEEIDTQFPDFLGPFVLFTGEGSEDVAADALNAGATSYVQKGGTDTFEYLKSCIVDDVQSSIARRDSLRFDALTQSLGDPVYVIDSRGQFAYVNEAFTELVGYDRAELIGAEPSLIKTEESVRNINDRVDHMVSTDRNERATVEIGVMTTDGETIPCEDHIGLLGRDDQFRGRIGVIRDISERKARERALARAKDRYQTLVEQNLIGLYIAREGAFVYHNDFFAELFGYEAGSERFVGEPVSSVVNPADESRLTELLADAEATRIESFRQPFMGKDAAGAEVHVEILGRGIEIDGEPAVIGTTIDVDENTEQYERLRRERDRLEEFVSVVSHDLRNPLNVAMSRAELLADEDRDSPHVEPLRRNLARMESIIEDLLTLARAGEGTGELELVSLAELSERCWQTVATDEATIDIEATGTVRADLAQLKRLLENLYRNAIEHGGNDIVVTVGETERGLYVADNGPGIPADQRDRVFQAGYSTRDDGTGFGLGIVERIAEAHGWEIEVGESSGGGARIDVTGVEFV